jgi:fructose-specific phosphotransferase system component IIB
MAQIEVFMFLKQRSVFSIKFVFLSAAALRNSRIIVRTETEVRPERFVTGCRPIRVSTETETTKTKTEMSTKTASEASSSLRRCHHRKTATTTTTLNQIIKRNSKRKQQNRIDE